MKEKLSENPEMFYNQIRNACINFYSKHKDVPCIGFLLFKGRFFNIEFSIDKFNELLDEMSIKYEILDFERNPFTKEQNDYRQVVVDQFLS